MKPLTAAPAVPSSRVPRPAQFEVDDHASLRRASEPSLPLSFNEGVSPLGTSRRLSKELEELTSEETATTLGTFWVQVPWQLQTTALTAWSGPPTLPLFRDPLCPNLIVALSLSLHT